MKARALALGVLLGTGRKTVTNLLVCAGMQFQDWSGAYRLFARERFEPDALFGHILAQVNGHLPAAAPLVVAIDDTLLRKSGKKVAGTAYRRDPLGPKFQTNLVWAQRFMQLSAVLPLGTGAVGARAVPIDFQHAPTPKKPKKDATEAENTAYQAERKKHGLPLLAAKRIQQLRASVDQLPGGTQRMLWMQGDGGFTNATIFKQLPERTVYTGRVRRDAQLHALPGGDAAGPGRKRVYGPQTPTPEQVRADESIPWQTLTVWAAGKTHAMRVKTMAPLRARMAGEHHILRLIVIEPLKYRLRKNSKILYRQPAYLVCTDTTIPVEQVVQAYVWRWEIEVNHRDEKNILGVGQAQVRSTSVAARVPAFMVAVYAMVLLAAHQIIKDGDTGQPWPRPKWRKKAGNPQRPPIQDIIQRLKTELWSKALGVENNSGFTTRQPKGANPEKYCHPHPANTVLFSRN